MNKKEILIFSGPSGVGKTALWEELKKHDELRMQRVVTVTTRSPRAGEIDGVHYHFLSREDFLKGVEEGDFIEDAEVHGNYYGSTYSELESIFAQEKRAVYIIDPQGARHFTEHLSGEYSLTTFFILPPSLEELERRLHGRGSEDPEAFKLRLQNAVDEMKEQDWFDYRIVNDTFEHAVAEIKAILDR